MKGDEKKYPVPALATIEPTNKVRFRRLLEPTKGGVFSRAIAIAAAGGGLLSFGDVALDGLQKDLLDPKLVQSFAEWALQSPRTYKVSALAASYFVLFSLVELVLYIWRVPFQKHDEPVRIYSTEDVYRGILAYAGRLMKEEHFEHFFRVYDTFSRHLWLEGQLKAREELGLLAYESAAKIGDDHRLSQVLIDDLGWTRVALRKYADARTSIERGIEKARAIGSAFWESKGLRHLSGIETLQNRYVGALQHLDEAEKIALTIDSAPKKQEMLLGIAYARAMTTLRDGKPMEALTVIQQFSDLCSKSQDHPRAVRTHALRGHALLMLHKWQDAQESFIRGLREAERSGRADEVIRNHKGLAQCYHQMGNSTKANDHSAMADRLAEITPIPYDIELT